VAANEVNPVIKALRASHMLTEQARGDGGPR
jgi:hypothetical protein